MHGNSGVGEPGGNHDPLKPGFARTEWKPESTPSHRRLEWRRWLGLLSFCLPPPSPLTMVCPADKQQISRGLEGVCLSPPLPAQSPVVSTMAGAAPSALTLARHQLEMKQRPPIFPGPMDTLMASKMKSVMRGKAIRPRTNTGVNVVAHTSDAAYECRRIRRCLHRYQSTYHIVHRQWERRLLWVISARA